LGDCLLWTILLKLRKLPKLLADFFTEAVIWGKIWTGLHFWAILGTKNSSGVDFMIPTFCDFRQFSAKKWRFSQKPML
jgi:hypothetical protein